ncbi:MAG: AarF/ABC1/UbiB kinase family protein [Verrucomicrobiales bacterium]|nr:AarF/ABC1/UbiB kinase family protein [Verrucomicrobiales bacterium]
MKVPQLGAIERLERDARRVGEIIAVLVKYGLADWLKSIPGSRVHEWLRSAEGQAISEHTTAERVRLAFTELGTTFIKLGQMLGTRPDLIGLDLARELSGLQTHTRADPPEVVEALLTAELGAPPAERFAHFEPAAFASASIAQVHRARLPSGERVVVKVQRTGIEKRIQSDLSILASLAELAQKHVAEFKPYEPVALVRQFRRTILQELDFTRERRNLETFALNFANDDAIHFPRAWPEYSSRRVLTMEELTGIQGSEAERLQASPANLSDFARRGAGMYLEMIFRDSFYHADPHPGNLMWLPGGVVGVLDCGMTGRLDEGLRDDIENLLLAVAQKDAEGLTDAVWHLSSIPPDCPREQLRADLADFVAEYAGQSIRELDLSGALQRLTEIIRRHRLFLPPGVSLLLRTLVLLEGTAQLLSPAFSLAEVIEPFYSRVIGRRLSPRRILLRLQRSYRDWDRLLGALPRELHSALMQIRVGRFTVHLDHRHLDPVVNRLVLGIMTASLFLGSSLLWSMKAPPLLGGVSVFGAAGYLLAVYLGWRLFRAVRKSGNVDSRD